MTAGVGSPTNEFELNERGRTALQRFVRVAERAALICRVESTIGGYMFRRNGRRQAVMDAAEDLSSYGGDVLEDEKARGDSLRP